MWSSYNLYNIVWTIATSAGISGYQSHSYTTILWISSFKAGKIIPSCLQIGAPTLYLIRCNKHFSWHDRIPVRLCSDLRHYLINNTCMCKQCSQGRQCWPVPRWRCKTCFAIPYICSVYKIAASDPILLGVRNYTLKQLATPVIQRSVFLHFSFYRSCVL